MRHSVVPWIALGISLAITTIVWATILDLDHQSDKVEFDVFTQGMVNQIQGKLLSHEQVLLGFKGLFLASYEVEPAEFSKFFVIQEISDRFPDNQGIGFIEYVAGDSEKNELMKYLERYGLDFVIHPEGTRTQYYPVVLLEPQDVMNKKALGYDVYSENSRRQAIDQATKTGLTTLTGKITLIQETDVDTQNGFLMLVPIYRNNENGDTSELQGFVYSVFRMNDFVKGTLDESLFEHTELKIYDGTLDSENLFFDSDYMESSLVEKMFSKSSTINFGYKQWIFNFQGALPPELLNSHNEWFIRPVLGYGMSFLLFFAFNLFSKNIDLTKKMAKREKIAIVGELASRFSHDIRNPLSNIQMAVDMLQKKKEIISNRSSEDKFQIITKNLDRISHQVNDVLDFVRTHPLEKKEQSMLVCLSESVSTMDIPKNIKINLPNEDISIYGESTSLQIVCKNLILNSIQAIGDQEGHITIRFHEEPKYTIIELEDSGIGIPESELSEIFEPLVTTKQEGTGLGLVSCRNIIEIHDGTITAKNNPTTFTIKLPKK
jgi:CHASE1-domain containing sensor protein